MTHGQRTAHRLLWLVLAPLLLLLIAAALLGRTDPAEGSTPVAVPTRETR